MMRGFVVAALLAPAGAWVTMSTPNGWAAPKTAVNRRAALQTGSAAAAAAVASQLVTAGPALAEGGPYVLPDLPYPYDALEPHIDAATMKFHHDKHHAVYVAKANAALDASAPSITDLQKGLLKAGPRNAAGGHYNHCLFWKTMAKAGSGGAPSAALAKAIDDSFGSMDAFKSQFAEASAGVFGSGWCWLAAGAGGKLVIVTTPNQDNPLMEGATKEPCTPFLGLDVWEHAYYLLYQNRRPDYINAWFNVVNWSAVSEYYETYASKGLAVPVVG